MSDLEQTAMERLRLAADMSQRLYGQPLLITTLRKGADAMERMITEEGRETVRLLTECTQTLVVDLDELRRQEK